MSSLKPGWKMVKFGDIAQNVAVRVDPADSKTDVYVGLEHLDPSTLHLRQWGHPSDVTGQKLVFKKGDVIFARRRAYQRKLAIAEFDGICSAHAMVVRAKPKMILPEFLPFFLQSDMFMERAIVISVGSLSPTINWKTLKVQEFPLPPLDEQKRIAEILWAADEVVCSQSMLVKKVRDAQSVFFESRMKIDSANLALLGDALQSIVAGKSPQGASRPAHENEFGVLKVSAVGNDCFVETENKALVKQDDFNDEYELKPGFILVTRANASSTGVGRPCVVKSVRPGLMLSDKTLRLIPKEEAILKRFFYQNLLSESYRTYIEVAAGGTEAKNISQDRLKKAPIWLPPLETQVTVTKTLISFDQAIERAEASLENAQTMLRALNSSWVGVLHV
jgi:restriction endonuclease S subunit